MYYYENTLPSVLCTEPTKMLGISLDEAVFNSASALYYDVSFESVIFYLLCSESESYVNAVEPKAC
jgi:hypothetical protein